MFFKMLKSDLRHKKSLNFILFIFMTLASLLVYVSSVQLFLTLNEKKTVDEYCHPSDLIVNLYHNVGRDNEPFEKISRYLDSNENVEEYSVSKAVSISSGLVDFSGYDERSDISYSDTEMIICAMPRVNDLVYDDKDMPFYVENGTAAISQELRDMTGAEKGSRLRITADTGHTYEFVVAHIFKESFYGNDQRLILSDNDFEKLSDEIYEKVSVFSIIADRSLLQHMVEEIWTIRENSEKGFAFYAMIRSGYETFDIIPIIVSVLITAVCFAIILIVAMTIRFMMISALKDEEKEIGMMNALGIDSIRFRWIFAAKYIAFSAMGGILGIAAGIPASKEVIATFSPQILIPDKLKVTAVGIVSVVLISVFMVLICMLIMHRIKNISAVDALHGENHGERYGRSTVFFLHRMKHMKVPFYLAFSDIVSNFRKYLLLIVSYSLSIAVMLSAYHIRNSVICPDFMKYMSIPNIDFFLDISDENLEKRMKKNGDMKNDLLKIMEELRAKGIPARVEMQGCVSGTLEEGSGILYNIRTGDVELSKLSIKNGGRIPELENEIMLSRFTAEKLGIEEGDTVTFEFKTEPQRKREFIVTALFNSLEFGVPEAVLGRKCKIETDSYQIYSFIIDAPESEKPYYVQRIKDELGDSAVIGTETIINRELHVYDRVFSLLEKFITAAAVCVMVMITALYMNIFIYDERHSIGLMRSIGIGMSEIRKRHICRMVILLIVSLMLANIIADTLGILAIKYFFSKLTLTGFRYIIEPFDTYVRVPLTASASILITAAAKAFAAKDVCVWDISEE